MEWDQRIRLNTPTDQDWMWWSVRPFSMGINRDGPAERRKGKTMRDGVNGGGDQQRGGNRCKTSEVVCHSYRER